jgi:hypothetical protein
MIIGTTTTDGVTKVKTKTTDGVVKAVECACCGFDEIEIIFRLNHGGHFYESMVQAPNGDYAAGGTASSLYIDSPYLPDGVNKLTNDYYFKAAESLAAEYWTSSINLTLKAQIDEGCYDTADEEGFCTPRIDWGVTVTASYRGQTKSKETETYAILNESGYASYVIGTLTVYETPLGDGSYFEIL